MLAVRDALTDFVAHYVRAYADLRDRHDPQWPSPCAIGPPDAQGFIRWQPSPRHGAQDLAPLERALDVAIHPDICSYFGAFWSGGLEATAPDGSHVSLILLWNDNDVARLIENQIGHALTQRRTRAPLSLFVACAEPTSDLIYTVENHSGRVLLERPGARPLKEVAPDLATFLQSLQPAPPCTMPPLM